MLSGKKGQTGAGVLAVVYITIIVLIGMGLFLGMRAYYGNGYDFRGEESEVLLSQVVKCFNENGFFENIDEFYETCNIKKETFEGDHLVYLRNKKDGKEFFVGTYDFKNRCKLDGAQKKTSFPLCKSFDNRDVEIIVASSQNSKVVAT